MVERIVGVQPGEEVEQRKPAAEKDRLFPGSELATIKVGDLLEPHGGPGLRLRDQII